MNHRYHFIAALDANPSDQAMRRIFADWLEENGDGEADTILAAGLRWMADNGKWPEKVKMWRKSPFWFWWCSETNSHEAIPGFISYFLAARHIDETRHAAEVNLAGALWEAGITRFCIRYLILSDFL